MLEAHTHYLSATIRGCKKFPEDLYTFLDSIIDVIGLTKITEIRDGKNPKRAAAVLKESHAVIYVWPDRGLAFLDMDTCNPNSDLQKGLRLACEKLEADLADVREWVPGEIELDYRLERTGDGYRTSRAGALQKS